MFVQPAWRWLLCMCVLTPVCRALPPNFRAERVWAAHGRPELQIRTLMQMVFFPDDTGRALLVGHFDFQ